MDEFENLRPQGRIYPEEMRELAYALARFSVDLGVTLLPGNTEVNVRLPISLLRDLREAAALINHDASTIFMTDGRFPTLADVEKEHIARALRQTGGNRQKAAKLLGAGKNKISRVLGYAPRTFPGNDPHT